LIRERACIIKFACIVVRVVFERVCLMKIYEILLVFDLALSKLIVGNLFNIPNLKKLIELMQLWRSNSFFLVNFFFWQSSCLIKRNIYTGEFNVKDKSGTDNFNLLFVWWFTSWGISQIFTIFTTSIWDSTKLCSCFEFYLNNLNSRSYKTIVVNFHLIRILFYLLKRDTLHIKEATIWNFWLDGASNKHRIGKYSKYNRNEWTVKNYEELKTLY
jgi:hypothetical protein